MEPKVIEKEPSMKPFVTELGPLGFGAADASISLQKKLESGRLPLEIVETSAEIIKSGNCLVPVVEKDDGCIDGRGADAAYVYLKNSNPARVSGADDSEFVIKSLDNTGHERAKVAGAGYVTGVAVRIGVGDYGDNIDDDIVTLGRDFNNQGVFCGAHTGPHTTGETCDCGANDRFPEIIVNGVKFEEEIRVTMQQLLHFTEFDFRESVFERVMENWRSVSKNEGYFEQSSGSSRLGTILEIQSEAAEESHSHHQPAMTKRLHDNHNETDIIVNYIPGTTVDQAKLRANLLKKYPDATESELPQAFVVDVWRIIELAQAAVSDDDFEAGLYSGVMYQLATAATLTDGSLRVSAYTSN